MKERVETSAKPRISLHAAGDAQIRGWAESAVQVMGDRVEQVEKAESLLIDAPGDLSLLVPRMASLEEVIVSGDLALKNVEGPVHIAKVSGDMALQSTGAVRGASISGDVAARHVDGDFEVNEIHGDASIRNCGKLLLGNVYGDCAVRNVADSAQIRQIQGDMSLRNVGGDTTIDLVRRDLILSDIGGILTVAEVNGDIRLKGGLCAGKHQLKANGDIVVRWPEGEPLRIEATASSIKNLLPLENVVEEKGTLSGSYGEGETTLILTASGRIILKLLETKDTWWAGYTGGDLDFDLELDLTGLDEKISKEINTRVADWAAHIEKHFGPEMSATIDQKAQEAASRAERAAERAMRKAEKAIKRAQYRAMRHEERHSPLSPKQKTPGRAPQATEEEQLKILKMVEEGKISTEEAGMLLEAIGS